MLLTDLADVCRRSGLPVVEVDGWRTRTRPGGMAGVRGIVAHHTGTAASAGGDYPSLGIVRAGRPDLNGPLAQLGLGRSGRVYVIAAGRANHAGRAPLDWTNEYAIGIEAEHPGAGPWPDVQYRAYVALCKVLADHYLRGNYDAVRGHKEIALPLGRKPDPTFDMGAFRAALRGSTPTTPTTGDDDEVSVLPTIKPGRDVGHPATEQVYCDLVNRINPDRRLDMSPGKAQARSDALNDLQVFFDIPNSTYVEDGKKKGDRICGPGSWRVLLAAATSFGK